MTYDKVVQGLENAGFVLDEYGGAFGREFAYAVYIHPCGVVAAMGYVFTKADPHRDSWVASKVTGLYWTYAPDYRRHSTTQPEGYVAAEGEVKRIEQLVDALVDELNNKGEIVL